MMSRSEKRSAPKSLGSIEFWAFSDCKSQTEVIIPESVKIIEPFTFDSFVSLKTIYIPSSLSYIWEEAFTKKLSLP